LKPPARHTPETDAVIRNAYDQLRQDRSKTALAAAARQLGWSRYQVVKRGRTLGLTNPLDKAPWTAREEELLENWADLSAQRIANKLGEAGFRRTAGSVAQKLCRLRLLKTTGDGYSFRQLAAVLGVEDAKVSLWVRRGFLKMPESGFRGSERRHLPPSAIRAFLLNHPEEIVLAKIDPAWTLQFLDLVSGGRLCGQYRKEIAA
jgi:hypothetical protein